MPEPAKGLAVITEEHAQAATKKRQTYRQATAHELAVAST